MFARTTKLLWTLRYYRYFSFDTSSFRIGTAVPIFFYPISNKIREKKTRAYGRRDKYRYFSFCTSTFRVDSAVSIAHTSSSTFVFDTRKSIDTLSFVAYVPTDNVVVASLLKSTYCATASKRLTKPTAPTLSPARAPPTLSRCWNRTRSTRVSAGTRRSTNRSDNVSCFAILSEVKVNNRAIMY